MTDVTKTQTPLTSALADNTPLGKLPGHGIQNLSRRRFLITTAVVSAGLTLGIGLPGCGGDEKSGKAAGSSATPKPRMEFKPNAFLRIYSDNSIVLTMKHLEMGQGSYTGLATLLAEDLDADWQQIRVESAPANAKLYGNLIFANKIQGTGGSTSMANSYEQMRRAGAIAREMLISAAAKFWKVKPEQVSAHKGMLKASKGGKELTASFGKIAPLAAKEAVPDSVFLKEEKDFQYIGKKVKRLDTLDKTTGKAVYTQDINLPGMLTALVAHPPKFGAKVKSYDAKEASKIKGVKQVVQIPSGIAVLAEHFWAAKKGRDALKIDWDESAAFNKSSEQMVTEYKALARKPGMLVRKQGDITAGFSGAKSIIKADYVFPYLAHAPMEPLNCVVQQRGDQVEIWNGAQIQSADQLNVAKVFGIKPEQVKINTLYAGGSFGRRGNPFSDYPVEAAQIVKAIKGTVPVKLVWTREDDTRAGYYRPLYVHSIQAGLDADGNLSAWHHTIVGQPIAWWRPNHVDRLTVEGAKNIPYKIPNINIELHSPKELVPTLWWRSVASTHNAYVVETFIDELAAKAGQDPVAFRSKLLAEHPRHKAVMELAAKKSSWGTQLPKNKGRGIAVHESFKSYVAQVAEVTVHDDKTFTVDRVVIAVDCGLVINPDIVKAQMEGGMGFGLSPAMESEITFKDGKVVQSNFHDYKVLRFNQMPKVEVYLVESNETPTGVGEPGTPVIAPAVANALFQATGKRYYQLPIKQV